MIEGAVYGLIGAGIACLLIGFIRIVFDMGSSLIKSMPRMPQLSPAGQTVVDRLQYASLCAGIAVVAAIILISLFVVVARAEQRIITLDQYIGRLLPSHAKEPTSMWGDTLPLPPSYRPEGRPPSYAATEPVERFDQRPKPKRPHD